MANAGSAQPTDGPVECMAEHRAGRRALHHRSSQPVDSGRCPARAPRGRRFHARQAGVDALDGRVGPVRIDFDDEFELVVGHGDSIQIDTGSADQIS